MRSNHNRMRRRLLEAGAGIAAPSPGIAMAMHPDALVVREQIMSIQLVRNATVKLRVGGRTLLIDPYSSAKSEGYSYAGRERSPLVVRLERASLVNSTSRSSFNSTTGATRNRSLQCKAK